VVPDLEQLARRYVDDGSAQASESFVRAIGMGMERRPRGLAGFARSFLGNSLHLWMWDYKSLARELAAAGFVSIRRASLGDSSESSFSAVEEPSRFVEAVAVECRAPL
jgi:hypothetical protein